MRFLSVSTDHLHCCDYALTDTRLCSRSLPKFPTDDTAVSLDFRMKRDTPKLCGLSPPAIIFYTIRFDGSKLRGRLTDLECDELQENT